DAPGSSRAVSPLHGNSPYARFVRTTNELQQAHGRARRDAGTDDVATRARERPAHHSGLAVDTIDGRVRVVGAHQEHPEVAAPKGKGPGSGRALQRREWIDHIFRTGLLVDLRDLWRRRVWIEAPQLREPGPRELGPAVEHAYGRDGEGAHVDRAQPRLAAGVRAFPARDEQRVAVTARVV